MLIWMTAVGRPEPMTLEAFLTWEDAQEEKHELIGGVPAPRRLRLMSGGISEHALIAANIIHALKTRLGTGPCRPFTSDLRVIMADGGLLSRRDNPVPAFAEGRAERE